MTSIRSFPINCAPNIYSYNFFEKIIISPSNLLSISTVVSAAFDFEYGKKKIDTKRIINKKIIVFFISLLFELMKKNNLKMNNLFDLNQIIK